jgi:hypothetical protein
LKPNIFEGKNFMLWRAKMELWLTTIHCYHAIQGKLEQYTPEEERKFLVVDNLFRGAVISALYRSMRKTTYLAHQAKNYGMLLRQSLEFLMLAVSCTL